ETIKTFHAETRKTRRNKGNLLGKERILCAFFASLARELKLFMRRRERRKTNVLGFSLPNHCLMLHHCNNFFIVSPNSVSPLSVKYLPLCLHQQLSLSYHQQPPSPYYNNPATVSVPTDSNILAAVGVSTNSTNLSLLNRIPP